MEGTHSPARPEGETPAEEVSTQIIGRRAERFKPVKNPARTKIVFERSRDWEDTVAKRLESFAPSTNVRVQPVDGFKRCKKGKWCAGMNGAIDGTRIQINQIYSLKLPGIVAIIPTLHSGDYKKKGIVINFCPFCRSKLGRMNESKRKK